MKKRKADQFRLIRVRIAYNKTCDQCISQEGGHYCLLWGKIIKDMNLYRCKDWKGEL